MHYCEVKAPAPLDRWVRCFWFLRVEGGPVQPVVPDGRVEIVLHRAEPFAAVTSGGAATRQESVLLCGQLTQPFALSPSREGDVVGIRFRTAAARDALALPLDEVTDRVVPLNDVCRDLVQKLERAARAPDAVAALSRVLLERVRPIRDTRSAVAVSRLAEGASVAQVAHELRMSTRTLERRVREDAGLPPKVLQRVMRFRVLYGLLQAGDAPARAALRAGYYDQAHANRDFRAFAGTAPTVHFAGPSELARSLLSDSS